MPDVEPLVNAVDVFVLCRGALAAERPVAVLPTREAAQRAASWLMPGEWKELQPGQWAPKKCPQEFRDWATIYRTHMMAV